MKIATVTIENVKGIKSLEFRPKTITILSGSNASGKSSVIDAVKSVFEGGHDPTLIRKGSKQGRIRMLLDTGTIIEQVINPSGTTREIMDTNGIIVPSPASFLRSLGDSLAVDPGKLLAIDASTKPGKAAIVKALLDVMPIEFTEEEVAGVLRIIGTATLPTGQTFDLKFLECQRKGIEETRRKKGVELKEQDATITQLTRGLPPQEEDARDWKAEEGLLRDKQTEIEKSAGDRRQDIRTEAEAVRQSARDAMATTMNEVAEAEKSAFGEIDAALRPAMDCITAELATAREKASQQERVKGSRATITTLQERATNAQTAYDSFTASLKALDALKKSKLENLPIQGLGFSEDTATLNGVEWHNVNRAERAKMSVQLSKLRAGALQFMVIDDSEHMDPENREALLEAAKVEGFQVLAAEVRGGQPLTVQTS